MNIESIRDYCLTLPGAEETLPFGPETLAYRINGKIFLLMGIDSEDLRFNVKCDPDKARDCEEFPVYAGFALVNTGTL